MMSGITFRTGGSPTPVPIDAISHDSPVKVGLVLVLLAAAGTAGTAHWRLGEAEQDLKQHIETATRSDHTQELRLQALEKDYQAISKTLDRIDSKLDQLINPKRPR
jgi:hypothetical protein